MTNELNIGLRDETSDCGELKTSQVFNTMGHGETLPQSSDFKCPVKLNLLKDDCFASGDLRVNENAGLASMHTLFMREHNRIVRELKKINPQWKSETCYEEARLVVIAMHQVITYKEYLPRLIGGEYMKKYDLNILSDGYYYGYNSAIDPSISNEFTTAAFRFGHRLKA